MCVLVGLVVSMLCLLVDCWIFGYDVGCWFGFGFAVLLVMFVCCVLVFGGWLYLMFSYDWLLLEFGLRLIGCGLVWWFVFADFGGLGFTLLFWLVVIVV